MSATLNNIPTELASVMSGIELIGHGGPEMLQYRNNIPVPKPQTNEVLIRVTAAGINNTDINTRIGWYSKGDSCEKDAGWAGNALDFPRIQGIDICGTIVAVGDNVDRQRIGQRVLVEPCLGEIGGKVLASPGYLGSECDGGFAQYTAVAEKHAYCINSSLSDIELASFPCSYSTAENMLTRANVGAKDRVLITGASGGVGSAAIQLAKARGADVIAVTSAIKKQQLLALGADQVVLRNTDLVAAIGDSSIDVVIDLVAGPQWPILLNILKPQGRYAVSGAIGGAVVELDIRTLYLKDLSFYGCTVLETTVFKNLIQYIEQQKIKPVVAQVFLLEQINQAQDEFLKKNHVGKIVLKID